MANAVSIIITIPARRNSKRLPNKLLRADTGRSVLAHTIQRASSAAEMLRSDVRDGVWVICDDEELRGVAEKCGARVLMSREDCQSGTERIWRAMPELPIRDVIVNLQADEPEMPLEWIVECADAVQQSGETDLATVAVPLDASDDRLDDPNQVKVVFDQTKRALYFSRALIPTVRDDGKAPSPRAFGHVGLYAYRWSFLQRYGEVPKSPLEESECLEQLRFLEAGARIDIVVAEASRQYFGGIDTEDDYRAFIFRDRARHSRE